MQDWQTIFASRSDSLETLVLILEVLVRTRNILLVLFYDTELFTQTAVQMRPASSQRHTVLGQKSPPTPSRLEGLTPTLATAQLMNRTLLISR
jgi:hypothetical protein